MHTEKTMVLPAILLLASTCLPAAAISKIDLDEGRDHVATLPGPVYGGSGTLPIRITGIESAYPKEGYLVHRLNKNVFKAKAKYSKPRYELEPSIDLGGLLTQAML